MQLHNVQRMLKRYRIVSIAAPVFLLMYMGIAVWAFPVLREYPDRVILRLSSRETDIKSNLFELAWSS